jgi:phosphate transport system substrate-binding protein
MAEDLVYVPMPAKVATDVEAMWAKEIKGSDGKPLKVTEK